MGDPDSSTRQCEPAPVCAGRFSFFHDWIRDHHSRELRLNGVNGKAAPNSPAIPFQRWRERLSAISMHDLRVAGLLAAPVVIGYIGVMSLIAIAGPASKWLLPKYFGPDPKRLRTVQDTLTGVALTTGFYFLAAVIVYFAFRVWCWKWVTPQIARNTLRRGNCAACKYPLSDLPPALSGFTVCPECGATWKLNARQHEKEQD